MDYIDYFCEITSELKVYNFDKVKVLCYKLIEKMGLTSFELDTKTSTKLLQALRNKRQFDLMKLIGDHLIQNQVDSPKIRRQYTQALIEAGEFTPAILVMESTLANLKSNTNENGALDEEIWEIKGLLGRANKQLYVNANQSENPVTQNFLKKAIQNYYEAYEADAKKNTWHGINVVALLRRASMDGVAIEGYPAYQALAKDILNVIEDKHTEKKANAWDFATAAEACLALKKDEALNWLGIYAGNEYCDAFELGSTLRQLEEVWQLNDQTELGASLLSLLKAELIKREGGALSIKKSDIAENMLAKKRIEEAYKKSNSRKTSSDKTLEKVFSDASFETVKNYSRGLERCHFVGRISQKSGKGHGTGFLIPGKEIHDSLGQELVFFTNAHVISEPAEKGALLPYEAMVTFETLDRDLEFKGLELIWSSPSNDLDTTVLRFGKEDQKVLLNHLKAFESYPIAKHRPVIDEHDPRKIYVIGHPYGGGLRLSINDNLLLDLEDRFLHYRTPTEEGSSGSPVFNDVWDLIGIHHAGHQEMKRLNGKKGTYQANEGILIQTLLEKIKNDLDSRIL